MVQLLDELKEAVLIRRYKRFLADVQLPNGDVVVVHCPNPGSMIGCAEAGSRIMLRHSRDPKRKLPYTWVMTSVGDTHINVDTLLANKLFAEAARARLIPALRVYTKVIPEYSWSDSRFDFLLESEAPNTVPCLVEVKSTTLADGPKAMFPDAKTERGRKHLRGLMAAKKAGMRAVQFYCVSRDDVTQFAPAEHIDPMYAAALREAAAAGVEVMAWVIQVSGDLTKPNITLDRPIEVRL